jgi:three-Cys-motif partner protein
VSRLFSSVKARSCSRRPRRSGRSSRRAGGHREDSDRCVTCDELLDRDAVICRVCGEDNSAPFDDLLYQLPPAVELDRLGAWSEAKHDVLTKYLGAYTTILDKQRRSGAIRRIGYIDAFAGAGVALKRVSGAPIPGSPLHALDVRPPFTEYHFIERDPDKAAVLRAVTAEHKNVRTYIGDHDAVLRADVLRRFRWQDRARAMCLLDPYGLAVKWSLIKTIAELKTVEIFFNFMVVGMNRNVLWKDPSRVTPMRRQLMTDVWGDESWREVVYSQSSDLGRPTLRPSAQLCASVSGLYAYGEREYDVPTDSGAHVWSFLSLDLAKRNFEVVQPRAILAAHERRYEPNHRRGPKGEDAQADDRSDGRQSRNCGADDRHQCLDASSLAPGRAGTAVDPHLPLGTVPASRPSAFRRLIGGPWTRAGRRRCASAAVQPSPARAGRRSAPQEWVEVTRWRK